MNKARWQRVALGFALGIGSFSVLEPAWAQELSGRNGDEEFIVSVDRGALARAVFTDSQGLDTTERFDGLGVVSDFRRRDTLERFELRVGIYATEKLAAGNVCVNVAQVGLPQPPRLVAMIKSGDPVFGRGYVSPGTSHVRVRNVTAHVKFLAETPEAVRFDVWGQLYDALHDPAIVSTGKHVDTPEITLLEITRVEAQGSKTSQSDLVYNIILEVEGDDAILFPDKSWTTRARRLENGHYEVTGRRDRVYGEVAIRAARGTSEICVVDVKERVKAATKVGPSWITVEAELTRARERKARYGLSDLERNEIFAKLRKGDGLDGKADRLVNRLRKEGATESVPVYLEILDSQLHPSAKATALRGYSDAKGTDGLDEYREFASDTSRSLSVRALSVQLIARYGTEEDKDLLPRIARSDGIRLPSVFASDRQRKQLEKDKYDGIDVLKYELWRAARTLEGRFPSP